MENKVKNKIIEFLRKEKWYPMIKVTEVEYETSKLLNTIIDNIIDRLEKEEFND